LTLVIVGEGGIGVTTTKFTFPPLTDIVPVAPAPMAVPETKHDPALEMRFVHVPEILGPISEIF
jgi:hypothetical protein